MAADKRPGVLAASQVAEDGHGAGHPQGIAAALPADEATLRALVGAVLGLASRRTPAEAAQALADAGTAVAGADFAAVGFEDGEVFVSGSPGGAEATLLELPILVAGAPYAVLRLQRDAGDFDDTERQLAFLLASHGAVMLERLDDQGEREVLLEQARRARAEAMRARAETSGLEDIVSMLAEPDDVVSTAETAVGAVLGVAGAEGAALLLARDDGDELDLVASRGLPDAGVERLERVATASATAIGESYRASRAVFTAGAPWEAEDDRDATGIRAAALPLLVAGRATGVLALTFTRPQELGSDERSFLTAVAEIAGQALERARRARLQDQAARLQALTEKLSEAWTERDVLCAVVEEGASTIGAVAGTAALFSPEGDELAIVYARGYPSESIEALSRFAADAPYPLAAAARYATAVVIESREELARRFPALVGVSTTQGAGALVALPLVVGEHRMGALGFTFVGDRSFDHDEVSFLLALAGVGAQALDRAQRTHLLDRVERLQVVAAALSNASTVPEVADVIVAQGVEALGARAGAVALAPDATQPLEIFEARGYPADKVADWPAFTATLPEPLTTAARSGEAVLLESIDAIRDGFPEVADVMVALGDEAIAAVPLKPGGGGVGAMAFSFSEGRTFDPQDRVFIAALAELCSQAVQRAGLFAAVEASRNRLRELLERLQEGLLAVTPDLVVEFANAEAEAMLAGHVVVGERLADEWAGFELGAFAGELFRGGAPPPEQRFRMPDGRAFEIAGIPGADTAVILVRDVSRRERHERAEREFIANAAHELRSPLTGIVVAVEALQLGAKEEPRERDRLLAGIEEEGARLTRLVHALLVLARAQADPESLVPHRVEVAPLVTEIAHSLDVRPAVRVEVEPGDPLVGVNGERILIEVALQNVARNAGKHTERGRITFGWRETGDGRVAVEVRDTGSGMPPEVRERVFDRFYRGGEPDRSGFGLGLPLVREMMRILGGEVSIESTVGVGTTVRMLFPAA